MRTALVFLFLVGCAPEGFPEDPVFAEAESPAPPQIAPIDPILAQAATPNLTAETEAELQERGATLRARADALRTETP